MGGWVREWTEGDVDRKAVGTSGGAFPNGTGYPFPGWKLLISASHLIMWIFF